MALPWGTSGWVDARIHESRCRQVLSERLEDAKQMLTSLAQAYPLIAMAMRQATSGGDHAADGRPERSASRLGPRSSRRAAAAACIGPAGAEAPARPASAPLESLQNLVCQVLTGLQLSCMLRAFPA